jgi:hypothetical protein
MHANQVDHATWGPPLKSDNRTETNLITSRSLPVEETDGVGSLLNSHHGDEGFGNAGFFCMINRSLPIFLYTG